MSDPGLLAELRAVFVDELADWLVTLDRHVMVLARPDAPPDELQQAVLQVRRAAHTLKGAARVVDQRTVEQICHQLESELPTGDRPPPDREAAHRVAEAALAALRRWHEQQRDERRASTPPPVQRVAHPEDVDAAAPSAPAPPLESGTMRVRADRLAEVSTLGEDLWIAAARGARLAGDFRGFEHGVRELRGALDALAGDPRDPATRQLRAALESLGTWALERRREDRALWAAVHRSAAQLGATARALRATRFDTLQPTLERTVRETARDVDRQVRLVVRGGQAELDRRIVDRLREALVHLLRNAVDHGIEPADARVAAGKDPVGLVEVTARSAGTAVILTVSDDGRGIDLAPLREQALARGVDPGSDDALLELLFEAGWTTRPTATSTSGRGIGLDAVRYLVSQLQGRIEVEPRPGSGARFVITVPGDVSVTQGLVVEVRGQPFVLLGTSVERAILIAPDDRRILEGRHYAVVSQALVPIVDAGVALGLGASTHGAAALWPALLLATGDRRIALAVDGVGAMQEVVVKPLGPRVRRAPFVTGATLVEEGDLACILDASALVRHGRAGLPGPTRATSTVHTVLVADDSATTRQLLASILQAAGYRVETAPDGEAAWRRLVERPPSLVVTDIEMPHVDGFQLLSRIRRSPQTSSLPVILVTALSSDTDRRRALELGADAYVVKGRFDQVALLDTIEELLP